MDFDFNSIINMGEEPKEDKATVIRQESVSKPVTPTETPLKEVEQVNTAPSSFDDLFSKIKMPQVSEPNPVVIMVPSPEASNVTKAFEEPQKPLERAPEAITPQPEPQAQPVSVKLTPEEMFERSGTDIRYKDEWMKFYEKCKNARETSVHINKGRAGRFKFNENGGLEFLPDKDVQHMSVEEEEADGSWI